MRLTALFLFLTFFGCAHHPTPLVLRYDDFGPQSAAYKLLGFGWYQWNSQGPDNPQNRDNVQVVIYRGLSLQRVQQQFSVSQSDLQDYRYISLSEALVYIDHHKKDLPGLVATRERLVSHFGHAK